MSAQGSRIGAVVVTHASPSSALASVASLVDDIPLSHIRVVVNAPARCDASALAQLRSAVTVVANERVRGYGANLNLGVESLAAGTQFLLLLNDDLVLNSEAIATLLRAMDDDPSTGIAAPSFVDPSGEQQAAVFRFPSIRSEVAQAAMLPPMFVNQLAPEDAESAFPGPPRTVDWVLGAAMLVRREAFEAVGRFDERFFLYSEETDLCLRMKRAGWLVKSCGRAQVVHTGGQSTQGPEFARQLGRSRGRFIRKHWSDARQLLLAAALIPTYGTNGLYVVGRILVSPGRAYEKRDYFTHRWRRRTIFHSGRWCGLRHVKKIASAAKKTHRGEPGRW